MRFFTLAAALVVCCISWAQTSSDRPNIVMINVDDLNDYQSYLLDGHPQARTPNLDRLARNGTIFQSAYCSSPKSAPSRTSFMSGKDPDYTGIFNNENLQFVFRENFQVNAKDTVVYTIPEVLRDSGYYTVGINKNYFGWKNPDYDNDYDVSNPDRCSRQLSWNQFYVLHDDNDIWPDEGVPGYIWSLIPDSAEQTMFDTWAADTAIQVLERFEADPSFYCDRPLFLSLGIFMPHKPLIIPSKYFQRDNYLYDTDLYLDPFPTPYNDPPLTTPYNGTIMPPQPTDTNWSDFNNVPLIGQEFAVGGDQHGKFYGWADSLDPQPTVAPGLSDAERLYIISEAKRQNAVNAYLAAVEYADYQIGRVLDQIENSGLANNTVIIFFSDHGYALGEKLHWHKFGLWETDNRIPMVIKDPRKNGGSNIYEPVTTLDLFPTILELAGIEEPSFPDGSRYLDGQSLVPFLDNPGLQTNRPALTSLRKHRGFTQCFVQFSVRDEDYHYIKWRSPLAGTTTEYCDTAVAVVQEELYHIGSRRTIDPNEWVNLAADPKYDAVKDYLSQWIADSSLFLKSSPSVEITYDSLPCGYAYEDTIRMSFDFFDPQGNPWATIPPTMAQRWRSSLDPETAYGVKNFIYPVSTLMDSTTFDTMQSLTLYLEVMDVLGRLIAQDVIEIDINPVFFPDNSFDVLVDGNEVEIINVNYASENSIDKFTWQWGDGSTVYDPFPAPHRYSFPGTYNIKSFIEFGNDSASWCRRSFDQNVVIDAVDFNGGECMAPQHFEVPEVGPNKVKFGWTPVYGSLAYTLRAKKTTGPDTSWIVATVPASHTGMQPNGLEQDMMYEVQVKTLCDVGLGFTPSSDWSNPLFFTTNSCYPPRNIQVDFISPTTAIVSWLQSEDADGGYIVYWGTSASTVMSSSTSGNSFVITGLTPGTTYSYAVVSQCSQVFNPGFFNSDLSELGTFTTDGGGPRLEASAYDLNLFPNPAGDFVVFTWESIHGADIEIEVTDMLGRVQERRALTAHEGQNQVEFDTQDYASGMYLVNLRMNGYVYSRQFAVEH